MSRVARFAVAIVLLQVALGGLYWVVEHRRAAEPRELLGTAPPEPVDMPMPSIAVRHRDGRRAELDFGGRRTLVHIWATWCPPCRAELPGVLALSARRELTVVAVALDRSWKDVEAFVGDDDLSAIVLAESRNAMRELGVQRLPVTFLVDSDGRIRLRFEGPRDWTDEAFVRRHLDGAKPPRAATVPAG